jgi:hypothetical protein
MFKDNLARVKKYIFDKTSVDKYNSSKQLFTNRFEASDLRFLSLGSAAELKLLPLAPKETFSFRVN